MTDQELLELAAKAAGFDFKVDASYFVVQEADTPYGPKPWRDWNPLADDGDALRLAVKLKIDVKQYEDFVVGWFDGGYIGTGKIMYEGDPYAATRRAIVRAAAAIGEKIP